MKKEFKFEATQGSGDVSAIYESDQNCFAILVLAHGAGANMSHHFMEDLASKLLLKNIAVLRFNFPYMEGTRGRPDPPARAAKTILNAIKTAKELNPDLPVFGGGKSFGGRMTSKLAADTELYVLKGIIYFGFPLHAPGKPGTERAAHLQEIRQPMLFLQGTRDSLATPKLIKEVTSSLPAVTVKFYEGADHSFKVLKKLNISPEEMLNQLASDAANWIKKLI